MLSLNRPGLAAALLLTGAVAAGSSANAQVVGPAVPLGAASFAASCSGAQDSVYTDRSCSAGNSSSSATLGGVPSVQAQATYPGNLELVPSGASANLMYFFAVIGGDPDVPVPINILLTLAASGSGPASYAFAAVKVTSDLGSVAQTICTFGCGAGDGVGRFTGVLPLFALAGRVGFVEMSVVAGNGLSFESLSANALADPYIYVDPAFADASRYSIVVSEGVGNSPPTSGGAAPEPAAWALMILGFGGVGAAMRRRNDLRGAL